MKDALPKAMLQVSATLPDDFPKHIADSIFENTQKIIKKI